MISVCIPTYNGELYIKEQLISILRQLGPQDEVIISDDGSTDNTLEMIDSLNDSRIKVFINTLQVKKNKKFNDRTEYILKKVSLNVQNALMHCHGDYIFLADQDDIWLEGRVSHTLELLELDEPTLVVCDCNVIDENYSITEPSYFNYLPPSDNFFRTILKSSFHGCCMCFNKALLQKVFPFPDYSLGHDLWIGLTAIKFGEIKFVRKSLISYRRHSATVTMTGNKSKNSLRFKLYYRFMIIIEYLKIRSNK